MDYEKKYKEANDKVAARFGTNVAKEIFTDLYESENDRIRKEILSFCQNKADNYPNDPKYANIGKWIDWLEKQDENKPIIEMITPEESLGIDSETYNEIVNACIFGENKPKFKVGDWIVNRLGNIWHIDSFDAKNYQVTTIKGEHNYFPINIQDRMHLWTIDDAKDGDVLAIDPWSDYSSSFVAIYKKQNGEDFDSYCFVGFDGKFYKGENGHSTEYIHPATKEQRALLFQKMHEAGYELDAEKKELKKIEQKPTNEPKFKIGDYIERKDGVGCHAKIIFVGGNFYGCEKLIYPEDESPFFEFMFENQDEFRVSSDFQQKLAWNEEDERILDALITSLINERFAGRLEFLKGIKVSSVINWLKSLKEKIKKEAV